MSCSQCGAELRAGLAFCTSCGTPAPAAPPPAAAAFCGHCGAQRQAGLAFCTGCGARAQEPVVDAVGAPAPEHIAPDDEELDDDALPHRKEAPDLCGEFVDDDIQALLGAAVDSIGGELYFEEAYGRWLTVLSFPDERQQRVHMFLSTPNERASTYLGDGAPLLHVASAAGPYSELVDDWMVFRRASRMFMCRPVVDHDGAFATLRVRGVVPYAAATPEVVGAMVLEVASEADDLEIAVFGHQVDDEKSDD